MQLPLWITKDLRIFSALYANFIGQFVAYPLFQKFKLLLPLHLTRLTAGIGIAWPEIDVEYTLWDAVGNETMHHWLGMGRHGI